MIQHTVEVTINRSSHEVFAFLTTTANLPKWQDSLLQVSNLTGEPWHAGTHLLEQRKIGGRKTDTKTEITYLEPNRGFGVKSLDGPQTEGDFRLESITGGTRLRFTIRMRMGGLMRFMEPFIAGRFKQDADRSFHQLKQLLER